MVIWFTEHKKLTMLGSELFWIFHSLYHSFFISIFFSFFYLIINCPIYHLIFYNANITFKRGQFFQWYSLVCATYYCALNWSVASAILGIIIFFCHFLELNSPSIFQCAYIFHLSFFFDKWFLSLFRLNWSYVPS
jgi:hypothetical protein